MLWTSYTVSRSEEILDDILFDPTAQPTSFSAILNKICHIYGRSGDSRLILTTDLELQTQIRLLHKVSQQAHPTLYERAGRRFKMVPDTNSMAIEQRNALHDAILDINFKTKLHKSCYYHSYAVGYFLMDLTAPRELSIPNERGLHPIYLMS